jgi:hypothetical protein
MNQKIKEHLLTVTGESEDELDGNIEFLVITHPEIYSEEVEFDANQKTITRFRVVDFKGLVFGFRTIHYVNQKFTEIVADSYCEVEQKVKIIEKIYYEPKG